MKLFDAHFHIIDSRFPVSSNAGFLPETFTCTDYTQRMQAYPLVGGAVVSASFQGFDQEYLCSALQTLGPGFVGVTQLPHDIPDEKLISLNANGVRGLRFNLKRGGSADPVHLESMALRVNALLGWHVELYADAAALKPISGLIASLPRVSIDHLGLSASGFDVLLRLAEQGVRVKATGFGRCDLDIQHALRTLYAANPDSLMFGTDLPSTRAPRAYADADYDLVMQTLGETGAEKVFYANAAEFYRLQPPVKAQIMAGC